MKYTHEFPTMHKRVIKQTLVPSQKIFIYSLQVEKVASHVHQSNTFPALGASMAHYALHLCAP